METRKLAPSFERVRCKVQGLNTESSPPTILEAWDQNALDQSHSLKRPQPTENTKGLSKAEERQMRQGFVSTRWLHFDRRVLVPVA